MEQNGNGSPDIGSFEWLFAQRLRSFQASGASDDDVQNLKTRGQQMRRKQYIPPGRIP
jgi:hypothetical protein